MEWLKDHIAWLVGLLLAALGWIVRREVAQVQRLDKLENRMSNVEQDLKDAKSSRVEQMRVLQTIQKGQSDMTVALARIEERQAKD